jgi:hypothetical protein
LPFPTVAEFLFNAPLYVEYQFDSSYFSVRPGTI